MIFLKDFYSVKTSSFFMHARANATVPSINIKNKKDDKKDWH